MVSNIEQNGSTVRVYIDGNHGPVLSGQLVGKSFSHFALQRGSTYDVYDSDAQKVATIGSSDWSRRRGEFSL